MRSLIVLLLFAPLATAQAPKPAEAPVPPGKLVNTIFANWSQYPKGTVVIARTVSEASGQKSETIMTSTLVEVTADKVVVEIEPAIKVAGQEVKQPPTKMEFLRLSDAPPGYDPKNPPKPEGVIEQSDKTVTVAGKEYKARYTKIKQAVGDAEILVESWTSDDVPGMILKSSSSYTGGAVSSKSNTELVEIKKPKK